jgi:hypothetical protein
MKSLSLLLQNYGNPSIRPWDQLSLVCSGGVLWRRAAKPDQGHRADATPRLLVREGSRVEHVPLVSTGFRG